jgi:tetratricopeptide (TPR) repeat protein
LLIYKSPNRKKSMYIDPWQWFFDFEWEAHRTGKLHYLELPRAYRRAWQYLERSQYDDALSHFKAGRDLAVNYNLPEWDFFFESWISEVYVLKTDYRQALDATAKLVTKSLRPEHEKHPCRPVVYFTLAWVYYYVDALGYEDDVLAALDSFGTPSMPLDEETHQRSFFLRSELAYEKEDYRQAEQYNAEYMERVEGVPFRQSSGYGMQRLLAFARGDLQAASEAACLREQAAREASLPNSVANSILWEGVVRRYMGDNGKAESCFLRGMSEYNALNLPKQSAYYHILASYHQARGDYAQALSLRDTELELAIASGSLNVEFACRLERGYLLNRMGKPNEEELAALKACAKRSKKPDFWLSKAETVAAGQTARYSWMG